MIVQPELSQLKCQRSNDDIASLHQTSEMQVKSIADHDLRKKVCVGFGLVLLPLQQPQGCHCGTPLHVWMMYCPNVDMHGGLNWLLFAAAGVAHNSGSLGGD